MDEKEFQVAVAKLLIPLCTLCDNVGIVSEWKKTNAGGHIIDSGGDTHECPRCGPLRRLL